MQNVFFSTFLEKYLAACCTCSWLVNSSFRMMLLQISYWWHLQLVWWPDSSSVVLKEKLKKPPTSSPIIFSPLCFYIYHSFSLLPLSLFLQRLPDFEHHTVLTYWPSTPRTRRERTIGKLAYESMHFWFLVCLFLFMSVYQMGLSDVTVGFWAT